jgi:hypothetical protein
MQQGLDRLKEKLRGLLETFGARELSGGRIDIDYDKFLDRLGVEAWLELRRTGDDKFRVSGAAGAKPKIKVKAVA